MYDAQNLDHPRVNPLFYSRPTRYVYFNASQRSNKQGDSGPPQVTAADRGGILRMKPCRNLYI